MISRRQVLGAAGAAAVAPVLGALPLGTRAEAAAITRKVPSNGEAMPMIGMGTWRTFNVGSSDRLRAARSKVLQTFFDLGGGMIDSSPMYGTSEDVIGWCLKRTTRHENLVTATKVWTSGKADGVEQMAASRKLWGIERFDVMQIHNLVDWETHLATLRDDKAAGRVRMVGITTSHGRRHGELAEAMQKEQLDFVQLTYNITNREAERRLLPIAAERGIGIIVNRPFERGALFDEFGDKPLPGWAKEIGAENWAQVFLKYVISHPAVTVAIPATTQVAHMKENMGAMHGPLPDAALRKRMAADVAGM